MKHQAVLLSPLHAGRAYDRNTGICHYNTVSCYGRSCTSQSALKIAVGYFGADVVDRSRTATALVSAINKTMFSTPKRHLWQNMRNLVRDRRPTHEKTGLLEAKPPSLAHGVETTNPAQPSAHSSENTLTCKGVKLAA